MLRVCVVGSSVAGLTSAALLSRSALVKSVTVIDPASQRQCDHFSTGLWSSALAVLRHLGEDLVRSSGFVEASGFRSSSGVALCEPRTTLGPFGGDAATPSLHFVRNSVLLEALRRAAARSGKLSTVAERVVRVRCSNGGGPVTAVCSGGDEHDCDLLLIADGMLSPLREQLCSLPHEAFLRHRGYRVYYGHTSERVSGSSFQSWGDGKRFACVPTDTGNQWFATVPSSPPGLGIECIASGPLSSNSRAVPQQDLRVLQQEFFAGWHPEVAALLSSSAVTGAVRSCEAVAFSAVPSRGSTLFSRHEVLFMGDSGFTLDPILAQGAGLAIEEAALYCHSLLCAAEGPKARAGGDVLSSILRRAASGGAAGADTKALLSRAAKIYAALIFDRRRRLFFLSDASQLLGSLCAGAATRNALLRATPAALKGRVFDALIGVSNGNGLRA